MDTTSTQTQDDAFAGGYVAGLLSLRYWMLRSSIPNDANFLDCAQTAVPLVVQTLMESMCRVALDKRIFESGWKDVDRFLAASSPQELRDMLLTVPDAKLQ
jgi:hypothetical protein